MEEREPCKGLELISVDRKELLIGALFISISFLMPLFFNVHTFSVLPSLFRALIQNDKTDLVAAAVQLVALNSIRGIPHYVGAYFVGESLSLRWHGKRAWPINSLLILVMLVLSYRGIYILHNIRYDFGIPAMLVCFFVLFFRTVHYRYISLFKKAAMIMLVLTALQFLDVMPMLQSFPVGRGDTSVDIKLAAQVLEAEAAVNTTAAVGMLLFMAFALIIFFQFRQENSLRELSILREQNQNIQLQVRLNEMENRTHQEMQYLVHDLKSPLTTVQTLVGVLKLECEAEARCQDIEYLDYIENAVERMSEMISEVLYENQQAPISTEALLGVVLAQCSVSDYAAYLQVSNQLPDTLISANRFLFPRALINLLENSARAIPSQRTPELLLQVSRGTEGEVVFSVTDNGTGISPEQLDTIWDKGTSGHQSSGLGLAFVRSVVERMHGSIQVESTVGQGCCISILLPEEASESEEDGSSRADSTFSTKHLC